MRNKTFIISLTVIAASIAGLALSILLIFEYFGAAPAATDAVCVRGQSSVNACTIVSTSRFAAVRGIPLIGDVPTAVLGFAFYGFIAAIVLMNRIRRNNNSILPSYIIILIISGAAFLINIALYLISLFIIHFVCLLCLLTYASTAVIFIASILIIKNNTSGEIALITIMKEYLKKQIPTFVLIMLALVAAGMWIGVGAKVMADSKEASTYQDRLNIAIRQYEGAKETAISLTERPVIGNINAQAHFIIFFDFTCIHCRTEFLLLEKMMKKYPDDISLSFKFFPLKGDCDNLGMGLDEDEAESCIAMVAAQCAHHQGKYMEYAKTLFNYYHIKKIGFSKKTVREAAVSNRLNIPDFDRCLASSDAWGLVNMNSIEGERLGIKTTPTIFLNGKLLTAKSRKEDMLEGLVKYCIEKNKEMK